MDTDNRHQVEKLFDITCTLIDVLACVPGGTTFEFGPRDYLSQLLGIISNLRGGQKRFMPLLMSKMHDTLPSSVQMVWPSNQQFDSHSHPDSRQSSHVASPFGSPAQGPSVPMASSLLMFDNISSTHSPVSSPDYSPVLSGIPSSNSNPRPPLPSSGAAYNPPRHPTSTPRSQPAMTSVSQQVKYEMS